MAHENLSRRITVSVRYCDLLRPAITYLTKWFYVRASFYVTGRLLDESLVNAKAKEVKHCRSAAECVRARRQQVVRRHFKRMLAQLLKVYRDHALGQVSIRSTETEPPVRFRRHEISLATGELQYL